MMLPTILYSFDNVNTYSFAPRFGATVANHA